MSRCQRHGGTFNSWSHYWRECDLCHLEEIRDQQQALIEAQSDRDTEDRDEFDKSACGHCGQDFVESTRRFPKRGKKWVGRLSHFKKDGICPKCYFELQERGGEVEWAQEDWRGYYERKLAKVKTSAEANRLQTDHLKGTFPEFSQQIYQIAKKLETEELAAAEFQRNQEEAQRKQKALAAQQRQEVEAQRKQQELERQRAAEEKQRQAAEAMRQEALERQRIEAEAQTRQDEKRRKKQEAYRQEKIRILAAGSGEDSASPGATTSDVQTLWQRVCRSAPQRRGAAPHLADLDVAYAFFFYEDVSSIARAIESVSGNRENLDLSYAMDHHTLRELAPEMISILQNESTRDRLEEARKIVRSLFEAYMRKLKLYDRLSEWSMSNSWIYIDIAECRFSWNHPNNRSSTVKVQTDPLDDTPSGLVELRRIAETQIAREALIRSRRVIDRGREQKLEINRGPLLNNLDCNSPSFGRIEYLLSRPLTGESYFMHIPRDWQKLPVKLLRQCYTRDELSELGSLLADAELPNLERNIQETESVEKLYWSIVKVVALVATLALLVKLVT